MTGRTHDLFGFTLLHIVFLNIPVPSMSVATGIGSLGMVFIGALTPDIDQPTADLWRRLPAGNVIGRLITPILGSHRMISHSLLGIVLFGYVTNLVFQQLASIILIDMNIIWWSFMVGFVSHIIIDLVNKEGVPLLFPLPFKFGFPPLRSLRLKAGGMMEKTVLYPILLLINAYLVSQHYQTYLTFFREFIK